MPMLPCVMARRDKDSPWEPACVDKGSEWKVIWKIDDIFTLIEKDNVRDMTESEKTIHCVRGNTFSERERIIARNRFTDSLEPATVTTCGEFFVRVLFDREGAVLFDISTFLCRKMNAEENAKFISSVKLHEGKRVMARSTFDGPWLPATIKTVPHDRIALTVVYDTFETSSCPPYHIRDMTASEKQELCIFENGERVVIKSKGPLTYGVVNDFCGNCTYDILCDDGTISSQTGDNLRLLTKEEMGRYSMVGSLYHLDERIMIQRAGDDVWEPATVSAAYSYSVCVDYGNAWVMFRNIRFESMTLGAYNCRKMTEAENLKYNVRGNVYTAKERVMVQEKNDSEWEPGTVDQTFDYCISVGRDFGSKYDEVIPTYRCRKMTGTEKSLYDLTVRHSFKDNERVMAREKFEAPWLPATIVEHNYGCVSCEIVFDATKKVIHCPPYHLRKMTESDKCVVRYKAGERVMYTSSVGLSCGTVESYTAKEGIYVVKADNNGMQISQRPDQICLMTDGERVEHESPFKFNDGVMIKTKISSLLSKDRWYWQKAIIVGIGPKKCSVKLASGDVEEKDVSLIREPTWSQERIRFFPPRNMLCGDVGFRALKINSSPIFKKGDRVMSKRYEGDDWIPTTVISHDSEDNTYDVEQDSGWDGTVKDHLIRRMSDAESAEYQLKSKLMYSDNQKVFARKSVAGDWQPATVVWAYLNEYAVEWGDGHRDVYAKEYNVRATASTEKSDVAGSDSVHLLGNQAVDDPVKQASKSQDYSFVVGTTNEFLFIPIRIEYKLLSLLILAIQIIVLITMNAYLLQNFDKLSDFSFQYFVSIIFCAIYSAAAVNRGITIPTVYVMNGMWSKLTAYKKDIWIILLVILELFVLLATCFSVVVITKVSVDTYDVVSNFLNLAIVSELDDQALNLFLFKVDYVRMNDLMTEETDEECKNLRVRLSGGFAGVLFLICLIYRLA